MTGPRISVLDHGYVRYIKHMGDDLDVVNSARVSFEKESLKFSDNDAGLLRYLCARNEFSPWRHSVITFECYAPLMTARQWYKYIVGGDHGYGRDPMLAWNESSRRYVTEDPLYYTPEWRAAPESKKQGSQEFVAPSGELETELAFQTRRLRGRQQQSHQDYKEAIAAGIAPEQARVFLLGYGLYVRWRWTTSLQGVLHFLDERLHHKAQSEFREYAAAVRDIATPLWPLALEKHTEDIAYYKIVRLTGSYRGPQSRRFDTEQEARDLLGRLEWDDAVVVAYSRSGKAKVV